MPLEIKAFKQELIPAYAQTLASSLPLDLIEALFEWRKSKGNPWLELSIDLSSESKISISNGSYEIDFVTGIQTLGKIPDTLHVQAIRFTNHAY